MQIAALPFQHLAQLPHDGKALMYASAKVVHLFDIHMAGGQDAE